MHKQIVILRLLCGCYDSRTMQTINNHLSVLSGRAALQGVVLPGAGMFPTASPLLTRRLRGFSIVLLTTVLMGCNSVLQRDSIRSLPPEAGAVVAPPFAQSERAAARSPATAPAKREARRFSTAEIMQILQLLDRAYVAEAEKHLTTPSGSSAWDFYDQVLAIAPGNEAARSGQGSIIEQYLSWTDGALRRGQPEAARNYYSRLRRISPAHPRLSALDQRITQLQREAEKRRRSAQAKAEKARDLDDRPPTPGPPVSAGQPDTGAVAVSSAAPSTSRAISIPAGTTQRESHTALGRDAKREGHTNTAASDTPASGAPALPPQPALEPVVVPFPPGLNVYPLDAVELRGRSVVLETQLALLADEIKARNARVLIEVPRDDQGRWVYQQLNTRHENYRIRAIIERTKKPVIRLLD